MNPSIADCELRNADWGQAPAHSPRRGEGGKVAGMFRSMGQKINYWKLVIWKASSGSAMVIIAGLPAVLLGWESMSHIGRTLALCGMAGGVIKFLDGFFDQTFSRVAQGKPPIALPGMNGNTENHTEVNITSDTVITPK